MKKKIIVKCPSMSQSGYGEQARFALRALREKEDLFDIYLLNIPWGKTGNALLDKEEKEWIDSLNTKTQLAAQQNGGKMHFDISLQITIPNEFEKMADVNIGYTAGIETTKVAPQWIEKGNMMDKIIVPSNHSKSVFEQTVYKAKNQQTGDEFDFKLTTPIEVCAFPAVVREHKIPELHLETSWNFLTVAQWGPRKNVEATLVSFLEEFRDEPDIGLVMKLNIVKNNVMDRLVTEKRVKNLIKAVKNKIGDIKCKVYVLHGNMTEEEMRGLYHHQQIKAFITTTHGEGFGLPIFDAATAGLPVIAPAWSSYVDFLYAPLKTKTGKVKKRPCFAKVEYDLRPVQQDAVWDGVVQKDSQWCWVKQDSVQEVMRDVFEDLDKYKTSAEVLKSYIPENFSEEKQNSIMINAILDKVDIDSQIVFSKQPTREEAKKISFCISTNGKKVEKTLKSITSIQQSMQQSTDLDYEIVVCGVVDEFVNIKNILCIDASEDANTGKLARLRNIAAEKTTGDVVVFLDDDILFSKEWTQKFKKYNDNNSWDVLGNKILLPNGGRYWDRATVQPHVMVPYTVEDTDPNLYQTGCFWIVRKATWQTNKWNDDIAFYAERSGGINEDVEYSRRLIKNGYHLKFDKDNVVWHWDHSYRQVNIDNGVSLCLKETLLPEEMKNEYVQDDNFTKLLETLK
jgi:glycosyltransferase involved in cell wall biosynthesis